MKANKTPRSRILADERAAFPVFEALMVALIVFSAILFLTSLQRPTVGQETLGIDLGDFAADTLDVLVSHTFDDPFGSGELAYHQWMDLLVAGNDDIQTDVDAYLDEVLEEGTRYALRLDNGVTTLHLLPEQEPAPRAGRGAQTFFFPNWTVYKDETVNATHYAMGEALDFSSWTTLTAPNGQTAAPNSSTASPVTWLEWWEYAQPAEDVVPENILFGTWQYTSVLCPGGCYVHVGLPNDTKTDHATYALQLVVWYGA